MEKNRKTTALVIAALVVSVISLGVAFAAFSTQLNISGTAEIERTSWDIHFTTDTTNHTQGGTVSTDAGNITLTKTGESTTATLTGTSFTWAARFKTPGDKVQYHFYVTNQGDYNAVLSDINTPQITCTTGSNPATAETTYCSKISYTVSYDAAANQIVGQTAAEDDLEAGETKDIYVTATLTDYTDTISTPPTSDISVDLDTITLVYTQSGNAQ